MKKCSNCKKEFDDDKKFCASCGAKLTVEKEEPSIKEESKNKNKPFPLMIVIFVAVAALFVFAFPFPYTATEVYHVQEPYTEIEYYTEQVPVSVQECHTEVPTSPTSLISRGINAVLNKDVNQLVQVCENVMKLQDVQRSREVTKYRSVEKQKTVTKTANLYQQWTGQTSRYYRVD